MYVREARSDDRLAARSIFDAAMLQVPDLDAATVFVAVAGDGAPSDDTTAEDGSERVLGALAADAERSDSRAEIDAVAVRPGRRGQGIGAALVAAATERWPSLVAEFDAGVRPFYESLGFEVTAVDEDRFRGVR